MQTALEQMGFSFLREEREERRRYIILNVRSSRPSLVSCCFKVPDGNFFFFILVLWAIVHCSEAYILKSAVVAQKQQPKVIRKWRNMAVFQETFLFTKRE